MSDAKAIMEMIRENDITYVDLRFTDPRGKMQHVTQHIDTIDEETLAEGFIGVSLLQITCTATHPNLQPVHTPRQFSRLLVGNVRPFPLLRNTALEVN